MISFETFLGFRDRAKLRRVKCGLRKIAKKSCRKLLNLQSRKVESRKFAQNVHARANLYIFLGNIFYLGRTKPYKSFWSRNVAINPF